MLLYVFVRKILKVCWSDCFVGPISPRPGSQAVSLYKDSIKLFRQFFLFGTNSKSEGLTVNIIASNCEGLVGGY